MKLIKIIRSSIRKNPNGGSTRSIVPGCKTIRFRLEGQLPEHILSDDYIIVTCQSSDFTEGYLINEDKIPEMLKLKNCEIEVDNNHKVIRHLPEPAYLYEYENPILKCDNCKGDVHLKDIEYDYDSEGNPFTMCPGCHTLSSFEEVEFERIEEVIKELKK
ncbi:MAG: hypothetical protein QM768_21710 [Agriterribacter sp.]